MSQSALCASVMCAEVLFPPSPYTESDMKAKIYSDLLCSGSLPYLDPALVRGKGEKRITASTDVYR